MSGGEGQRGDSATCFGQRPDVGSMSDFGPGADWQVVVLVEGKAVISEIQVWQTVYPPT